MGTDKCNENWHKADIPSYLRWQKGLEFVCSIQRVTFGIYLLSVGLQWLFLWSQNVKYLTAVSNLCFTNAFHIVYLTYLVGSDLYVLLTNISEMVLAPTLCHRTVTNTLPLQFHKYRVIQKMDSIRKYRRTKLSPSFLITLYFLNSVFKYCIPLRYSL